MCYWMKIEKMGLSVCYVWKQIRLCFLFGPRTRLLCLTCAKGPGNNMITPAVIDSSCPRGSRLRLQVRSGRIGFPHQPPPSSRLLPSFSCYLLQAGCDTSQQFTHTHTHTSVSKHRQITSSTSSRVAKNGAKPPLTLWLKQGFTSTHRHN